MYNDGPATPAQLGLNTVTLSKLTTYTDGNMPIKHFLLLGN